MKNVLGRGLSSLVSSQPVPVRLPNSNAALKIDASAALAKEGIVRNKNIVLMNKSPLDGSVSGQAESSVLFVPVADISSGQFQPRQDFSETEIKELSNSIQTHGVLQPVILRRSKAGAATQYELIAGERRWRAAQMAGLLEIPAILKSFSDQEALEIAIVENVQRHDLNSLEEALAYQRLATEFSLTQEQVAQKVGKERATVANLMRLLKLSPEVQEMLRSDHLSAGHAKALLAIKEHAAQLSLAKKVVSESLSVRELESLVSRVAVLDTGTRKATEQFERVTQQVETVPAFPDIIERLRNSLATKVMLKHKKSGSGVIEIQYHSENELDRLIESLCRS